MPLLEPDLEPLPVGRAGGVGAAAADAAPAAGFFWWPGPGLSVQLPRSRWPAWPGFRHLPGPRLHTRHEDIGAVRGVVFCILGSLCPAMNEQVAPIADLGSDEEFFPHRGPPSLTSGASTRAEAMGPAVRRLCCGFSQASSPKEGSYRHVISVALAPRIETRTIGFEALQNKARRENGVEFFVWQMSVGR